MGTEETKTLLREALVARAIAQLMLVHVALVKESPEILAAIGDPLGVGIVQEALQQVTSFTEAMPRTEGEMRDVLAKRTKTPVGEEQFHGTIFPDILRFLQDGLRELSLHREEKSS